MREKDRLIFELISEIQDIIIDKNAFSKPWTLEGSLILASNHDTHFRFFKLEWSANSSRKSVGKTLDRKTHEWST